MTRSDRMPGGFVAWLRQVRRSAWLLIGLCLAWQIGDAAIHDLAGIGGAAPAVARGLP